MTRTIETAGGKTYFCIGDAESCLQEIIRNELGNDCEEMFCEVLERAWSAGQDENRRSSVFWRMTNEVQKETCDD